MSRFINSPVNPDGLGGERARPRIGIYEPSPCTSGPSQYVESILAGIDPVEFEVVLFCHKDGPYTARPGVVLEVVMGENRTRDLNSNIQSRDALGGMGNGTPLPVTFLEPARHGQASTIAHAIQTTRPGLSIAPSWLRLWRGFGRESLRLADCFARRPVDLLHTNNTGCEESAVAARLAGIAQVLGTFHVDWRVDVERKRNGLRYRALEWVSNHCLDTAIAVSDSTGGEWARRTRLSPGRVVTIRNGIDPRKCAPSIGKAAARRRLGLPEADDCVIVGAVGRLDVVKGFDVLLEAMALLAGKYPRLILALAGEGPARRKLEEQAARLGIAGRIHFLGFCAQVKEVYAALDIFAMPSRCEALPYALLEAMVAELPAVGSDVGGVPEVIVSGETGILVAVGDCRALAAGMKTLLDDEDLRQRMGRAGRERVVREFSEREMVARTIEVYRRMLNGARLGLREGPRPVGGENDVCWADALAEVA